MARSVPQRSPRRLESLEAYRDALARENESEQLAYVRQDIGQSLMDADPPNLDAAAENLQGTLDYWHGQGKSEPRGETILTALVGQMLDVLLKAKKYPDAAAFAEKQIAISEQYQQTVGSKIKNEAARLATTDPDSARALIEAALSIKSPPLDEKYVRDLEETRDGIQKTAPAPP